MGNENLESRTEGKKKPKSIPFSWFSKNATEYVDYLMGARQKDFDPMQKISTEEEYARTERLHGIYFALSLVGMGASFFYTGHAVGEVLNLVKSYPNSSKEIMHIEKEVGYLFLASVFVGILSNATDRFSALDKRMDEYVERTN